jgi:glycosyltransferase involved in cell wall biosynthesis
MEAPPLPAKATIVHVDAESGFSGGEVQVFHLMRGLARSGWRQVLVAPPGSEALARAGGEGLAGLELESLAMRNNADVGAALGLRRILKRLIARGPVVLQLHTGRATWLGALASAGLGSSVVTTRRMDRDVKRGLRTRLVYGRLVDRAVAISGAVHEALLAGGVPADKVSVIYSCVDPADFELADRASARSARRAELGAEEGELVLLVLARLDPRKGVDVLLAAFERLRAESGLAALRARNKVAASSARRGEGPNNAGGAGAAVTVPALWIAGDGPARAGLEAQAEKLNLGAHVRFLGARTDRPELLAAADALVLPSRREGLGVAALEAMAAGLPVVATRVGGLAEAVVDGRTGLLVEPEDARALAAAIGTLVEDRSLAKRLGAAGPGRIRETYHVDTMVAAYEELYHELLGTPRACEDGALP